MKNTMQTMILVLALLCSLPNVQGQSAANETPGGWELQTGWRQILLADQHASPLLYTANLMQLGGSYRTRTHPQFELQVHFQLGTNQAQTLGKRTGILQGSPDIYGEKEAFEVVANPFLSFLGGQMKAGLHWPIGDRQRIGAQVNLNYMLTGLGLDTWHYTQLDLSPTYSYHHPLGPGQFKLDFSLPILAVVQRPTYAFDPSLPDEGNYYKAYLKEATEFASLDQLINPQLQLGYIWHRGNGKRIGLHYQLSWMSYPDPRPVRMLGQGLSLTLTP